ETLALLAGLGKILGQHHEAVEEPRLAVEALVGQFGRGAHGGRRQRQSRRRAEHEIAPCQHRRNHPAPAASPAAIDRVYIAQRRSIVSQSGEVMLLRLARLALLTAVRADDLADFNAAVEQAAAHNRAAIGYLRTGNTDLAAIEIDRLRQAWAHVGSVKRPEAFDRQLYVKEMTDIAMRLVTADMLITMDKPDNARASLIAVRDDL